MMFSTSSLYFLVAIYGESIETNKEVHGLQLVHGQGQEVTEPGHNENQEKAQNQVHNESNESVEQRLKEGQEEQVPQNGIEKVPNSEGNESKHIEGIGTEETSHEESASEAQRRNLEFPLSIGAGVGYAAIGIWMILDKRKQQNSLHHGHSWLFNITRNLCFVQSNRHFQLRKRTYWLIGCNCRSTSGCNNCYFVVYSNW